MTTLYHHASPENAAAIARSGGRMFSVTPDDCYFSTRRNGRAKDWGRGVVTARIPSRYLEHDEESPRSGERWYKVPARRLRSAWFV